MIQFLGKYRPLAGMGQYIVVPPFARTIYCIYIEVVVK